ncbi:MAG: hypothetical protein KY475_12190 [Planctomycetes bacterium]|nr:hypothetical protein [Planctomycetota bacterium]
MRSPQTWLIRLLLASSPLGLIVATGTAQEPTAENVEIEAASDVAVLARPPYAVLPPLDCLHCYGPAPSKYCFPGFGPRGYLYYGTYPYNDDWFNGFRDCPGGACGNPGAILGLGWIQAHNALPRPRQRMEHRSHSGRAGH